MPEIINLTSLSDPALDVYSRLTETQLRSRLEPEKGVFIAESPNVIAAALDAGCRPLSLLTEPKHIEGSARQIIARCGDIPVYTGESALLERLTGYRLSRGVLCAMRRPAPAGLRQILAGAARAVVLENLVDAANIGAVFRSAAALGMDAVLLTPDCCDPLNRRAARVSMGAVFRVPWARTGAWPQEGISVLKELGFCTAALALSKDAVPLDDPSLPRIERLALVLGNEGDGLPQTTLAACDLTVRIPMMRGVDSLNVAAAGAVAFWQLGMRSGSDLEG